MDAHVPAHVLEGLADTLWQERHMVESLLFRMVEAKLLLAANEHRFVAAAIDDVEDVVDALRRAEERRHRALQDVADRLEVPVEELTLTTIAALAPSPMDRVFTDHHEAFLAMTTEIEETAAANRQLASGALGRLRRSLDALAGANPASTYTSAGTSEVVLVGPAHLDATL